MSTTAEQLLIDATLTIARLQAWLDALSVRTLYYKNGDSAWADEAAVLAGIPEAEREQYMLVNIAGVEYWFDGSPLALVQVATAQSIADGSITLAKLVDIAGISVIGRKTATTGVPEVITLAELKILLGLIGTNTGDINITGKVDKATGYSLILESLIDKIHDLHADDQELTIGGTTEPTIALSESNTATFVASGSVSLNQSGETITITGTAKQNPYTLLLAASSDVATRLVGLVEGTDYPTGWTLAADSGVNLLVTHTLTGRKIASVNVWEVDGDNETWAKPFSDGFTQVVGNGLTVKIVGLDTLAVALRIELIFN